MKYLFWTFAITFINLTFALSSLNGLEKGTTVPIKDIVTVSGKKYSLTEKNKDFILVFFRGSWCPYCMSQLKSIESDIVPQLKKNQILLAISVDKPIVAKKMKDKFNYTFGIVSDSKAKILKSFNISNKISDELVLKYKNSYSINIEGDSGESHHIIAHPAVYIVKDGRISFSDVHINYKERTDNKVILKELK
ncbi:peroxiredoxin family protein [Halobacteriovorax sp.]|uniref:peroxiredoxin family protein n=1 Tax=Halobacteriovorax sp. TaxID=2020862 RepID=UPI003AF2335D